MKYRCPTQCWRFLLTTSTLCWLLLAQFARGQEEGSDSLQQDNPVATAAAPATIGQSLPSMNASGLVKPSNLFMEPTVTAALPQARNKIRGFTIDIVADGSGDVGYLPVLIHLQSTSTFPADRRITLRFEPVELGQSPAQNGITCDVPLLAPQGSKHVRAMRYLPKWSVGTAYQLRVFEDGVELEDYAREVGTLLQRSLQPPLRFLANELTLSWLHIDDERPLAAVARLSADTAQSNASLKLDGNSLRSLVRFTVQTSDPVTSTTLPDLPADWRYYQRFDGVLVRAGTVGTLASDYPEQFQALRDWVMSGGSLVVAEAGSAESTLAALNFRWLPEYTQQGRIRQLIRTVRDQQKEARNMLIANRALVQAVADGKSTSYVTGYSQLTPIQARQEVASLDAQIKELAAAPQNTERVWAQNVAAGQVVGISAAENISSLESKVVIELFGYRKSATLRRGVDPMIGDGRVRRWMIPGVAQPPVYTFIGLLTVFVILVGPIAYRKTTQVGRGYLMFAIAPVLALTTTVAMFTYGVLADGFGTITRIRQLTWVDGASGDAIERVRSTYFAGVRPAGGLRFQGDAEVMAYPNNENTSWDELHGKSFAIAGKVDIRDDAQVFDNRFLPSRTQRQFIVQQPRHQLGKLIIHAAAGNQSTTLENGFDFPLRNVIVRDRGGSYWAAEQVDVSRTDVPCTSIKTEVASKLLADLYNRNRPLAGVRRSSRTNSYDRRIRDLVTTLNRNVGDNNRLIIDGVAESWLQKKLQVDADLPLNSFIAEADVSADVIAVDGAVPVESIRYVFGTLP